MSPVPELVRNNVTISNGLTELESGSKFQNTYLKNANIMDSYLFKPVIPSASNQIYPLSFICHCESWKRIIFLLMSVSLEWTIILNVVINAGICGSHNGCLPFRWIHFFGLCSFNWFPSHLFVNKTYNMKILVSNGFTEMYSIEYETECGRQSHLVIYPPIGICRSTKLLWLWLWKVRLRQFHVFTCVSTSIASLPQSV